jgi:DNA-binding MarR family transcriptional regulator
MMAEEERLAPRTVPDIRSREQINTILYLMRKLNQSGEAFTKKVEKTYQISIPQLFCLYALLENGPLPPSQIARHIMTNSSTVTGIIDRLEQKDLVKRSRNSTDRRVITISLTDTGFELARTAHFQIQQKMLEGLNRIPIKERNRIISSLSQLATLLDYGRLGP